MEAIHHASPHECGLPGAESQRWDGRSAAIEWSELDWDTLPQGLRDIKDLLGPGAAIVLAEEYGGGAVYVPSRIWEGHPLVGILGWNKARILSMIYGGDKLHVPKVDAIERQFRKRRILNLRQAGRSIASLAREFNLSCRRVRQLCE